MTTVSPEEVLREGRLNEALTLLQEQVRRSPSDSRLRIFLFQLLAVLGHWERALTQLVVCGDLDGANLAMVQVYREAIRAEAFRGKVFRGEATPVVFGPPEPWIAFLIEALRLIAAGHYDEAVGMRDQGFEQAPATPGRIDGQEFAWIADADTRLGPVLEAIVNGRYYWIPFAQLSRVALEAPCDLRDVVWLPAHLVFTNGGDTVALIPARYPNSDQSADNAIRLARKTLWEEPAPGHFLGLGQRTLATDGGEYSLLEARDIQLATALTAHDG